MEVTMIPVVADAFGKIPKGLDYRPSDLEIRGQ